MVANATCGVPVFRRGQMALCGEPAAFEYKGLYQVKSGETVEKALARRGRLIYTECMDHTRDTFLRMEPALRSGQATLKCIVHTRLTIYCRTCQSVFRFEPLPPTMVRMPGSFCPNCGHTTIVQNDPTLDYWEIISSTLGLGPESANFTARLHSEWVKDRLATASFVQYIQEIMDELSA